MMFGKRLRANYTFVGTYLDVSLERESKEHKQSLFIVVTLLGLSKGSHDIGVRVEDIEGGHSFSSPDQKFVSDSEEAIAFIIQEMGDFYFPTPGRYRFTFRLNGENFVTLPMNVVFPVRVKKEGKSVARRSSKSDGSPASPKAAEARNGAKRK